MVTRKMSATEVGANTGRITSPWAEKAAAKAIADMQVADPKDKNAFTRAAVNLQDFGLAKEADALMERAWILDPSDWQNCVAFGRACLRKARREAAARWFARASQAKPQEERMWNAVALAYADRGAEPS